MSENRSFEDNAYRSPLADYSGSKAPAGSVVRFDYETCDHRSGDGKRYKKSALVYLPAGFDENDRTVRYNVLYLMHGGSDSPEWYLGGEGKGSDITRMLDTMLAEGRCEPFIICAVSYYNEYCSDAAVNCLDFHLELTNDIIPLFEKKYPTFAEDTTDEALRASRFHRAMGGFSMGGVTTWSVFMNRLDLFGYFLPMCGDCWAVEVKGGGSQSEATAKLLADSVRENGFSAGDFYIYSGTADKDIAEPNLTPQIKAMSALTDTFVFCDNFAEGNLYECICENGYHDVHTVRRIMFNGMPKMFR